MELQLQQLSKSYGNIHALQELDYHFKPGIYALLGPNGAGKSTLINILVQNIRADNGNVLADGRPISQLGMEYRKRIGYIPQQQPLPGYFPLEKFLRYTAALKGLSSETAAADIRNALKVTNLWDRRSDKIAHLSGGMKQRVLIAQAILGNPDLLVMDEPTAGLDPKERIRIRNLISRISVGRIVLIATHVVSDVECIADHVLFIRKGRLIDDICPADLDSRLGGHVFEWIVPGEEADSYLDNPRISAMSQESSGIRIRMLSDSLPAAGAVPVVPHLEDMYLLLFGKEI